MGDQTLVQVVLRVEEYMQMDSKFSANLRPFYASFITPTKKKKEKEWKTDRPMYVLETVVLCMNFVKQCFDI